MPGNRQDSGDIAGTQVFFRGKTGSFSLYMIRWQIIDTYLELFFGNPPGTEHGVTGSAFFQAVAPRERTGSRHEITGFISSGR